MGLELGQFDLHCFSKVCEPMGMFSCVQVACSCLQVACSCLQLPSGSRWGLPLFCASTTRGRPHVGFVHRRQCIFGSFSVKNKFFRRLHAAFMRRICGKVARQKTTAELTTLCCASRCEQRGCTFPCCMRILWSSSCTCLGLCTLSASCSPLAWPARGTRIRTRLIQRSKGITNTQADHRYQPPAAHASIVFCCTCVWQ